MIVDPIEEGEKVKAEISSILYKDHIQHLKKQQQWWVQIYTQSDLVLSTVKLQMSVDSCACTLAGIIFGSHQIFINFQCFFSTHCLSHQVYDHFYFVTPYRPEGFMEELPVQDKTTNQQQEQDEEEDSGNSEDDDSDLFVNTNRCNYQYESEEEEDSEEEDDK